MKRSSLQKGNAIDSTIRKLEIEKSKISRFYENKKNLKEEDIKELLSIAMTNTDYTLRKFKEDFESL